MKLGKLLSVFLLAAVSMASVGFTTLSWYCPLAESQREFCGNCAAKSNKAPDCADDDCCKQQSEIMKIQADLSMAAKIQPNVDSPETTEPLETPSEILQAPKRWVMNPDFARALPDKLAQEHVVLRI